MSISSIFFFFIMIAIVGLVAAVYFTRPKKRAEAQKWQTSKLNSPNNPVGAPPKKAR